MQKIIHKKNRHRSSPYCLKVGKITERSYRYYFDEAAKYDLKGEDQFDWNKLFGISFHIFTSHRNSVMIGWRYNIDRDHFEFNSYCHIDGSVRRSSTLFVLETSGAIDLKIRIEGESVFLTFSNPDRPSHGILTHRVDFPGKLNRRRRNIEAWFGGNKKPGKKVCFTRIVN